MKASAAIRYLPVAGSRIKARDAQILGPEIARLENRLGDITPAALLDAARPKASALHTYFTWDNAVAGEKYRLEEAAYYLRSINFRYAEVAVRAFHVIPSGVGRKNVYRSTLRIVNSPEDRAALLRTALAELKTFRQRYSMLTELCQAVDQAIKKVQRKATKKRRH